MTKVLLNPRLIAQQKLTEQEVDRVEQLHEIREQLFDILENLDITSKSDRRFLRASVDMLETIEYQMQAAWKFDLNRDMHSWWYRIPHCTCPKMDNDDNLGTPYRIRTLTCPAHGDEDDSA
jgi:hypothetical protein